VVWSLKEPTGTKAHLVKVAPSPNIAPLPRYPRRPAGHHRLDAFGARRGPTRIGTTGLFPAPPCAVTAARDEAAAKPASLVEGRLHPLGRRCGQDRGPAPMPAICHAAGGPRCHLRPALRQCIGQRTSTRAVLAGIRLGASGGESEGNRLEARDQGLRAAWHPLHQTCGTG
jgi:hypothetical protein